MPGADCASAGQEIVADNIPIEILHEDEAYPPALLRGSICR
jgi:hypothetical protein